MVLTKQILWEIEMKIGLITGGGDAPGLNGIIKAAGRTLLHEGHEVLGILNGFEGIFEHKVRKIVLGDLHGLHAQAGTFLGASNKSQVDGREDEFVRKYKELGLDGLILAGGDGSFRCMERVNKDVNVIGVPKTIDNDLPGTDMSFGFDTACTVVADAMEALWHTAEAHERIFFVEAMGRTAGWIALGGGLASYADAILIPERPFSLEELKKFLVDKRKRKKALLIAVAEGAHPIGEDVVFLSRSRDSNKNDRLGGIAEQLATWVEDGTGLECRHIVLGHLQRSHNPTTTDRLLTLNMGVRAAHLAIKESWGQAVVYRNGDIHNVPIHEIMGAPRLVPEGHAWIRKAHDLGIFI